MSGPARWRPSMWELPRNALPVMPASVSTLTTPSWVSPPNVTPLAYHTSLFHANRSTLTLVIRMGSKRTTEVIAGYDTHSRYMDIRPDLRH